MLKALSRSLKKNNLLQGAGLLFISTLIVNAGNYLINFLLGRILGPAIFAEAHMLATGVLVISFFALGFQLAAAKYAATYEAKDQQDLLEALGSYMRKNALLVGGILTFILLSGSLLLRDYLQFRSPFPLIILTVGIPIYFLMSANRGWLQGTHQFRKLAMTYLAEMAGRLGVTVIVILGVIYYDISWASEGIALGFLASFLTAWWASHLRRPWKATALSQEQRKAILGFMLIIGSYELSQILINNSDMVLVKHFFESHQAGLYAALTLIGRMVFFATWIVVTLLIPKVVQRKQTGKPTEKLLWQAMILVTGLGLIITLVCGLIPELILSVLLGNAYISVGGLLWKYALLTTLFASANVFAYYYLSLGNYWPVVFSILAGISQCVGIYLFHESLTEVVWVQIVLMGGLCGLMIAFHLSRVLSGRSTPILSKEMEKVQQVPVSNIQER